MGISRPITRSTARKIVPKICQAIRFNGANNYGQLAQRAINPDGDNVFEFWTPAASSTSQTIISQNISGVESSREFQLFCLGGSSEIRMVFRGALNTILTVAEGADPETLYFLALAGNTYTIAKGTVSNIIKTGNFTRGLVRETLAPTLVGARNNGSIGNPTLFFNGLIPYIRINGTYWAMDAVGQEIQPSLPAGNNMTLFNTVPEQWETISCGLRS